MKKLNNKKPLFGLLLIGAVASSFFVLKNDYLKADEIANNAFPEETKNSFVIKNLSNVSIPIETIDKVHKFEINDNFGGFRSITTRDFEATDFGPNCKLYFIFHNIIEKPHRTAVFHIGNLAAVSSFMKVSETEYQITGEMFSNGKFATNEKVLITINATKILEMEKKLRRDDNDYEGDLASEIVVSIINVN